MARILRSVTNWLGAIDEVRQEQGVTAAKYGDATLLALIHVESAGNDTAHRDGSQFYGLLQMGTPAGVDVGITGGTRELHGEGYASIRAFVQYMERYKDRHHYQPSRIAALWKGGPGTAKTLYQCLRDGDSWPDSLEYAAEKHRIPNLSEYVRRFTAAMTAYSIYIDDLEAPYPRHCPVVPEPDGREPEDS